MSGMYILLGLGLAGLAALWATLTPPRLHMLKPAIKLGAVASLGYGLFIGTFFYAEPGFIYHVRTILGVEKMVADVGYNT